MKIDGNVELFGEVWENDRGKVMPIEKIISCFYIPNSELTDNPHLKDYLSTRGYEGYLHFNEGDIVEVKGSFFTGDGTEYGEVRLPASGLYVVKEKYLRVCSASPKKNWFKFVYSLKKTGEGEPVAVLPEGARFI